MSAPTSLFDTTILRINTVASHRRIRFVSATVLVMAGLGLLLSLSTSNDRQTVFGPQLGADYANFYIAGTILNSDAPERLYDLELQAQLYHELFPQAPPDRVLPYPYAPYFALFLRPLAILPFTWSYCVWLVLGLSAYCFGLLLLWKSVPELRTERFRESLLIAVSFMPFVIDGWIGGQSVGFIILVIGLSLFCISRGRAMLGGLALSLCLFKPTSLVLIVPMLIVRREYRALAGFLSGSVLMCALSWIAVGTRGLTEYARLLETFSTIRTTSPEVFRTWKYVDLTSFVRLLAPEQTTLLQVVPLVLSVAVFLSLVAVWWRGGPKRPAIERLSWACALVWTPLLSPQCGIYDVTLLIPGLLLLFAAAQNCDPETAGTTGQTVRGLAVILFVTAWVTQHVAMVTGVQLITLVIIGIGIYSLKLAWHFAETAAR